MARVIAAFIAHVFVLPILFVAAISARLFRMLGMGQRLEKPRLIWAGVGIRSLSATSIAMREAGYDSISVANTLYDHNDQSEFDRIIRPKAQLAYGLNTPIALIDAGWVFACAMFRRDVLHGYFNGGILGRTPLASWEYRLWKLSGGGLVLLPYGSDSFIYSKLPDALWAKALQKTYPRTERQDQLVASRVESFTNLADCVVGCIVHDQCLPRVDVRTVLWYPFHDALVPVQPSGTYPVRIAHSANHRLIKGTDFIEKAVTALKSEGLEIELEVLEGVPHDKVINAYQRADIIVDQVLFGYALSALEGLALGKVVVSGMGNELFYEPYLAMDQMKQCPIKFTSPHMLKEDLRELVKSPQSLIELGERMRNYAKTYHSASSSVALFSRIYEEYGLH